MSIIKGILDVGAVVILPIVMLILCLIFRIPSVSPSRPV